MIYPMRYAALALLMLAGCGTQAGDSGTAGSGTTGSVPGLAAIHGTYAGPAAASWPTPGVAGSTFRLHVEASRIGVNAGCNQLGGTAAVQDSVLVVSDLAMTEMGCASELMAQDTWIADLLTRKPQLERSGETLVLRWPEGSITLTRVATAPASDGDVTNPDGAVTNPDDPVTNPDEPVSSTP